MFHVDACQTHEFCLPSTPACCLAVDVIKRAKDKIAELAERIRAQMSRSAMIRSRSKRRQGRQCRTLPRSAEARFFEMKKRDCDDSREKQDEHKRFFLRVLSQTQRNR